MLYIKIKKAVPWGAVLIFKRKTRRALHRQGSPTFAYPLSFLERLEKLMPSISAASF